MEKKQTPQNSDEFEKDSRVYEVSYLIRADIGEPAVLETVAEKITAFFETKKVKIISESIPEYTDLAYEIRKDINNKKERFTEAAFGWTKFESDPAFIKELNDHFDLIKNVIRFLVVKTTEENTVLIRRERRDAEDSDSSTDSEVSPEVELESENKEVTVEEVTSEDIESIDLESKGAIEAEINSTETEKISE